MSSRPFKLYQILGKDAFLRPKRVFVASYGSTGAIQKKIRSFNKRNKFVIVNTSFDLPREIDIPKKAVERITAKVKIKYKKPYLRLVA